MAGSFSTFRGRRWWYQERLRQSLADPGQIRIAVKSMGWDRRIAQISAIPREVQTMLRSAIRDNAEMVADRAREYVPHGLETDNLHDSIRVVGLNEVSLKGIMATVEADTPYAHFVEMDVHPSYKKKILPSGVDYNWPIRNPGPTVFGRRQGGMPQGPHYMARAAEDTEAQSHSNIMRAVQAGVNKAMSRARAGWNSKTYDFDTSKAKSAYAFVQSVSSEMGINPVGGGLHPLDMSLGGFDL